MNLINLPPAVPENQIETICPHCTHQGVQFRAVTDTEETRVV
jgi:hypothetical protein